MNIKLLFASTLLLINIISSAQKFDPPQENPFGLTGTGHDGSTTALADLDGDGDLDLMSGRSNGDFYYFENTGTKFSPSFGTVHENPFGLSGTGHDGSTTALIDLDGDGDLDLMSGRSYSDFFYFENVGTKFSPSFGAVHENPFGLTGTGHDGSTTALADLDGDGDLDLMSGRSYSDFYYFENVGTKFSPSFGVVQENPFGLTGTGHDGSTTALADLDGDGDLDLMSGRSNGDFYYFENIGTKFSPSFGAVQENPFDLVGTGHDGSTTALADLDGDGDLDLMSGRSYSDFYYFKNSNAVGIIDFQKEQSRFIVYPNPSNGIFNISKKFGTVKTIEISNINGDIIFKIVGCQLNNNSIDLSLFTQGIYFLKTFDGEKYYTEIIVIK